jgi:predicted alpha/beta superfamily hydrolase
MHTRTGRFRLHERFHSRFLPADRDVIVYLPPDYRRDATVRYPVLYMHDGQNLFDRETAFNDVEWQVDEAVEGLIARGEVAPLIIVGVYNVGDYRMDEYTPTRDESHGAGGKAHLYGRMLVDGLKPFIDRLYRTLPGPEHTAIGGSSLGGLVSLHLALRYPHVFSRVAALSPAVWWGDLTIVREVRALACKPPLRIWLDAGTAEAPRVIDDARQLRDALVAKGWTPGDDLAYTEAEGAGHDELAWGSRMPDVLRFLFPAP